MCLFFCGWMGARLVSLPTPFKHQNIGVLYLSQSYSVKISFDILTLLSSMHSLYDASLSFATPTADINVESSQTPTCWQLTTSGPGSQLLKDFLTLRILVISNPQVFIGSDNGTLSNLTPSHLLPVVIMNFAAKSYSYMNLSWVKCRENMLTFPLLNNR